MNNIHHTSFLNMWCFFKKKPWNNTEIPNPMTASRHLGNAPVKNVLALILRLGIFLENEYMQKWGTLVSINHLTFFATAANKICNLK